MAVIVRIPLPGEDPPYQDHALDVAEAAAALADPAITVAGGDGPDIEAALAAAGRKE